MAAEAAILTYPAVQPDLPPPMTLVYTTIGDDALHLPNSNGGAADNAGQLTNLVKSILRGVPDITDPNFSNPATWYPPPATKVDGQPFNIYNLDPYVWFVHQVLHLSGYGFSVDDDTSDVGAEAPVGSPSVTPNNLQIVFSGLGDLTTDPKKNPLEWFPSVQWGSVADTAVSIETRTDGQPYAGKTVVTLSDPTVYWQISVPDLSKGQIGAFVSLTVPGSGPVIPRGTMVVGQGDQKANELILQLPPNTTIPNSSNVKLTFTGVAPSLTGIAPPPSNRGPSSSAASASSVAPSASTASPVQQLMTLALDEWFLTLDQLIRLADLSLGMGADPALATSIAAYQSAIIANPYDNTLLGQEVIDFINLVILNLVAGGLPIPFGSSPG
jgi:hypothetical protein